VRALTLADLPSELQSQARGVADVLIAQGFTPGEVDAAIAACLGPESEWRSALVTWSGANGTGTGITSTPERHRDTAGTLYRGQYRGVPSSRVGFTGENPCEARYYRPDDARAKASLDAAVADLRALRRAALAAPTPTRERRDRRKASRRGRWGKGGTYHG
jgi:hypothetical protein